MHQRRQLLFGFSSLFFIVAEMNFEDDQDLKLQVTAKVGGRKKSENVSTQKQKQAWSVFARSIRAGEDVIENSDKFKR